jgi:hypothetical protein
MAYRDDADALRARIEQLEQENRALRSRAEVGRAAHSTPRSERDLGFLLLGGPKIVRAERTVAGELSAAGHERLLDVLRAQFATAGETTLAGTTVSWKTSSPRAIEAMATALDGKTVIRVVERLEPLVIQFFTTFIAATTLGTGLVFAGLPIPFGLLLTTIMVGALLVARATYRTRARARAREIDSVADVLVAASRASVAPTDVRVETADSADDLAPDEAAVATSARARR